MYVRYAIRVMPLYVIYREEQKCNKTNLRLLLYISRVTFEKENI